jgi:hypothetical protein
MNTSLSDVSSPTPIEDYRIHAHLFFYIKIAFSGLVSKPYLDLYVPPTTNSRVPLNDGRQRQVVVIVDILASSTTYFVD